MPTPDVILLTIGKENNDWREFTARGFSENRDYSCLVGVDCTTESFPASMCTDRYCQENMDDDTARLVSINFTLDRDYSEVSLRLVRGGRESSLILVDSQRIHLVTFGMLGSNENWEVGEYDLMLGPLTQGDHTIQLFVLDDNRGNGAFGWDALSIFAWEED